MKKTVKIKMYLDCTDEWGDRRWNYVTTVWGDRIEFGTRCWYMRDVDDRVICCGSISKLHGDGTDDSNIKFKYVVRY